jgi:hypothetical protein
MLERRKTMRKVVDLMVKKLFEGDSYFCRACEISPTGIKLQRLVTSSLDDGLIDIEVPLVAGQLTTAVSSRRVWREGRFEAFEFVSPSLAQQVMLERIFGT